MPRNTFTSCYYGVSVVFLISVLLYGEAVEFIYIYFFFFARARVGVGELREFSVSTCKDLGDIR